MSTHSFHLTGVDLKKIKDCIGDPKADIDNPVLKAEQDAQVSSMCCKLIFLGFFTSFVFFLSLFLSFFELKGHALMT